MLTISIVRLGYIGDVNLNKVARLLNTVPQTIRAEVGEPIATTGQPDIYDLIFSDSKINQLLSGRQRNADNHLVVGVILNAIEDNFYVRSIAKNVIILTLYQIEEICEKSKRTIEEYLAVSLLPHMLFLQFSARANSRKYLDLFHTDTRGCIFDFTGHKPHKVQKMRTLQIDTRCKARLVDANVPVSIIEASEKILRKIKHPSLVDSFRIGLEKPIFNFFLGGILVGLVVNALTSLVLGELNAIKDYYALIFLFILLITLIVGHHFYILLQNRGGSLH